MRIHDFNGYLAYSSGSDNCRELDQGLCKLLNDDFGVCFDPAVYDKYNFFHVLEVYRDTERKKYLVYEQMVIQLNYSEYYYLAEEGWDECPFKLRRCNYVDDYSELVSKFRKYASERELYDIGYSWNQYRTRFGVDGRTVLALNRTQSKASVICLEEANIPFSKRERDALYGCIVRTPRSAENPPHASS